MRSLCIPAPISSLTFLLLVALPPAQEKSPACQDQPVQSTTTRATARPREAEAAASPTVLKVEPPSWWPAHSIHPVRLLVRGRNLHGAVVKSTRPEVQPRDVRINESGTYLFVSLAIDQAAIPGEYPLRLETPQGAATIPFELRKPLDRSHRFRGLTSDDVLYLIMPDRFSDGDPSNNTPADAPAQASSRALARGYHGGDFRGVIHHLPYLKDLGVTAIWLTPWYDNWNGLHRCDQPWCPYTYYHGYHPIDFYAVEDHFGDLATLQELVEKAHAMGIKVVQDQVANHFGSRHPWLDDAPLPTWIHGTREHHVKNSFQSDLLLSPHAPASARRPLLDGWFADDLPDLNQDEPEVARYLIQNALWWVGMTGIDGIREDTAQYMPRRFLHDLTSALHREYPDFWIVGEVLNFDPVHCSFFQGGHAGWDGIDTGLDSVFDFPTWATSVNVFTGKMPVSSLRGVLKNDALYPDPARLTTLSGNHDLSRFPSFANATAEGAMLHVAYLLATRGIPQLYAGDELGLPGGDDPDNRRDFPGGFPHDPRNAFESGGRTPAEQRMFTWTQSWIRLRRDHPALRTGALIDLGFDTETYAFARQQAEETLVVVINRSPKPRPVRIAAEAVGAGSKPSLQPLHSAGRTAWFPNGTAILEAAPRSAAVYRLESGN